MELSKCAAPLAGVVAVFVSAAAAAADTPPFAYTPSQTLSVVWDDATKTDLVEGASTQVGSYKATDAELVTDGLTSGLRFGRVYAGVNAASVNPATDWLVGTIGPFRWSGTATVDADGDIRTRTLLALPAVAPAASGGLPTANASNEVGIGSIEGADPNVWLLTTSLGGSPSVNTLHERLLRIPNAAPGTASGLPTTQDVDDAGGGGGGEPIAPTTVVKGRTWFGDPYRADRAGNTVTLRTGSYGTLAIEPLLNPEADIDDFVSVAITGPAAVTATDLAVRADGRAAHFDVPELETAGNYTVLATIDTKDGTRIVIECRLVVR